MDLKVGKIVLLSPSLGMALAVNGGEKWFVPQNRSGQFVAGQDTPELTKPSAGTLLYPPQLDEIIHFTVDEKDPAVVKLWATKQDYDAVTETIKRQKELTARPKIRYMEQLVQSGVEIGKPRIILPEMPLEEFLLKYPTIRNRDQFITSGDYYQMRKRWPETFTPAGWVPMEKDPRKKL
jgi:hypothetical protein